MREEQSIQQSIVKWFRLQYPKKVLFSVNNNSFGSGISSKRMGGINKSMGVLAGVSDLCLLHEGMAYFFEIKTEKGRQSDSQKEFEKKVISEGFEYHIIRSLDEFMDKTAKIIG